MTAISLPAEVFAAADALAKKLGMSRSGLMAAAIVQFVGDSTRRDLVG